MSAPAAGAQSHGDAITTVTSTPVSPFVFLRGRGQFDPFLFRASVPNSLYFFGADLPLRAFYAATVLRVWQSTNRSGRRATLDGKRDHSAASNCRTCRCRDAAAIEH